MPYLCVLLYNPIYLIRKQGNDEMEPHQGKDTLRWFDEFAYQKYPYVKALAARLLQSASRPTRDAEDIAQEFFLVAYRKAETVRTHPNQAAWVYRTVFLTFLNYHHKESRQKAGVPLESYEDIADDLVIDEIVACRDMLCRAVDKLPEKDYELYQDVYARGLSPAQIAAKEGKRTDTIARRISRLNQKLRENINKLSENGVIRHNISEGSSQS